MKIKFQKTEIPKISQKILDKILKTNDRQAVVVALSGELGSGKTTMTQELAKQFKIKNNLASPTFVIMKIYNIDKSSLHHPRFKKFIHIDAYRLEKASELANLDWKEIVSNKENLVIIEWPEKISKAIPKQAVKVSLFHVDENTRSITL